MFDDEYGSFFVTIGGLLLGIILLWAIIWGACALYAPYNIWSEAKAGEAELARADYNRKISVREAEAKKDSANYLAQADIIRAEGIAKANKIIGDSLKTNEKYLEWKFIDELPQNKNQIIYLPTNTVLPILEATRGQK